MISPPSRETIRLQNQDVEKIMWNDIFSCDDYYYGTRPNDFLAEHIGLLQGSILSLGEGEGRNAVFMAEHNLQVRAVDGSETGLQKARQLAACRGVNIHTEIVDLLHFMPSPQSVNGVISIFAHLPSPARRQLHQRSEQALRPGGHFLLEGYAKAQLHRDTGGPKNPDMLLAVEELLEDFSHSTVLLAREVERDVREGRGHTGLANVVQLILRKND